MLFKCVNCKKYTLERKCPVCGAETANPHPKFHSADKHGEMRRKLLY